MLTPPLMEELESKMVILPAQDSESKLFYATFSDDFR
jgi:hypothetical protein